jgi:hypothetical protein
MFSQPKTRFLTRMVLKLLMARGNPSRTSVEYFDCEGQPGDSVNKPPKRSTQNLLDFKGKRLHYQLQCISTDFMRILSRLNLFDLGDIFAILTCSSRKNAGLRLLKF